jgi:hypothetical protein
MRWRRKLIVSIGMPRVWGCCAVGQNELQPQCRVWEYSKPRQGHLKKVEVVWKRETGTVR